MLTRRRRQLTLMCPAPDELSLKVGVHQDRLPPGAKQHRPLGRPGAAAGTRPRTPAADRDDLAVPGGSAEARELDDDLDELATGAPAAPGQASPGGDSLPRLRVYRSVDRPDRCPARPHRLAELDPQCPQRPPEVQSLITGHGHGHRASDVKGRRWATVGAVTGALHSVGLRRVKTKRAVSTDVDTRRGSYSRSCRERPGRKSQ